MCSLASRSRRSVLAASALALALVAGQACSTLPSRVEEIELGASEWQVRHGLGQAQLTQDLPLGRKAWVYVEDEQVCSLLFEAQRLVKKHACESAGHWPLQSASAALKAQAEAAVLAAKVKEPPPPPKLHEMPPPIPVPGFR